MVLCKSLMPVALPQFEMADESEPRQQFVDIEDTQTPDIYASIAH